MATGRADGRRWHVGRQIAAPRDTRRRRWGWPAPIAPGVHEVASKTENDERMTFTSEPGKNVYVWQEVKMGVWSARSKLSLVDEPSARERIKACALHESELPPPAPVAAAPAPVVPGS